MTQQWSLAKKEIRCRNVHWPQNTRNHNYVGIVDSNLVLRRLTGCCVFMEATYHIAIYLGIGVTIQQKAPNKSEQEDEDAILREWNCSIRGMWQKSVTELRI